MNIHIAAHYLKNGYKVRRQCWQVESYMKVGFCSDLDQYHLTEYWKFEGDDLVKHTHLSSGGLNPLTLDDILADDWEIVNEEE